MASHPPRALIVLFGFLLVATSVLSQSNPAVADCGMPLEGEITVTVIYTLTADCTLRSQLSVQSAVTLTINGSGYAIRANSDTAGSTLMTVNTDATLSLNQVTIDGASVNRATLVSILGALNADRVTFRNSRGIALSVHGSATLTTVLFEDNFLASRSDSGDGVAIHVTANATVALSNAVARNSRYSGGALVVRDSGSLTATGCLSFSGNVPYNVVGTWTDNSSGACSGTIGNGDSAVIDPPEIMTCGLPAAGTLDQSATYTMTADCDLSPSGADRSQMWQISDGVEINIIGNGYSLIGGSVGSGFPFNDATFLLIRTAGNSILNLENLVMDSIRPEIYGALRATHIAYKNARNHGFYVAGNAEFTCALFENNLRKSGEVSGNTLTNLTRYGDGAVTFTHSVFRDSVGGSAVLSSFQGAPITLSGCISFNQIAPTSLNPGSSAEHITFDSTGSCMMAVGPSKSNTFACLPEPVDPTEAPIVIRETPAPKDILDPQPSPTSSDPPNLCIPSKRILVLTANDDLHCERVDIITLDKHPALDGGRFAVRLWRSLRQCMHRVVAGDNLYRLSIRYQTGEATFRRLNGIAGNHLNIGQDLLLPSCVQDGSLSFDETRICFENQGNLVFIDSSMVPPEAYALTSYLVNDMTCADVDHPGIVVLAEMRS